MANTKASPSASKWDVKAFMTALYEAAKNDPDSLSPEQVALLEIFAAGSPTMYASTKRDLLAFFRKTHQREVLAQTFREMVETLAAARKNRPVPAAIDRASQAGVFTWSPEEIEVARHAIENFRHTTAPERADPSEQAAGD